MTNSRIEATTRSRCSFDAFGVSAVMGSLGTPHVLPAYLPVLGARNAATGGVRAWSPPV